MLHPDDAKMIEEGWPKPETIPGTDAWYESLGICPAPPETFEGAPFYCDRPAGHPGDHCAQRPDKHVTFYHCWSTAP